MVVSRGRHLAAIDVDVAALCIDGITARDVDRDRGILEVDAAF